MDQGSVAGEV